MDGRPVVGQALCVNLEILDPIDKIVFVANDFPVDTVVQLITINAGLSLHLEVNDLLARSSDNNGRLEVDTASSVGTTHRGIAVNWRKTRNERNVGNGNVRKVEGSLLPAVAQDVRELGDDLVASEENVLSILRNDASDVDKTGRASETDLVRQLVRAIIVEVVGVGVANAEALDKIRKGGLGELESRRLNNNRFGSSAKARRCNV